jgi:hypothetical protein
MGSNNFRSTKRNITEASIRDAAGRGWTIHSDGTQHLRASVASDRVVVYINDWYACATRSCNSDNYGGGKLLRAGERIRSTLRMTALK